MVFLISAARNRLTKRIFGERLEIGLNLRLSCRTSIAADGLPIVIGLAGQIGQIDRHTALMIGGILPDLKPNFLQIVKGPLSRIFSFVVDMKRH